MGGGRGSAGVGERLVDKKWAEPSLHLPVAALTHIRMRMVASVVALEPRLPETFSDVFGNKTPLICVF